MKKAQMQLQGIEPSARLQLIPLCMASLEQLTEALQAQNLRCVFWHQDQLGVQVHDKRTVHTVLHMFSQTTAAAESMLWFLW